MKHNRNSKPLRIVSGGQTGVDRAALDAALELGLPCGGWCPRGRLAADGPIDRRYPLNETPTSEYTLRTEWNVRDSDGTLILSVGPPSGGTALTVDCARRQHKPRLVIDLEGEVYPDGVQSWILSHQITTLNIAGPREDPVLKVYERAYARLVEIFEPFANSR